MRAGIGDHDSLQSSVGKRMIPASPVRPSPSDRSSAPSMHAKIASVSARIDCDKRQAGFHRRCNRHPAHPTHTQTTQADVLLPAAMPSRCCASAFSKRSSRSDVLRDSSVRREKFSRLNSKKHPVTRFVAARYIATKWRRLRVRGAERGTRTGAPQRQEELHRIEVALRHRPDVPKGGPV